ncbi:aminoglycoside 6-adenylyltransferase [Nocardia lijiangensis]|uniref:aminoglycoside 6-adenylyltransferase n=1 Tax=Nocardia lijiangensis TaxID=299618 RepID=UPI00082F87C1|nr:aminoglycoside 6-adenylyltransferase [Nocardia lijiangensis]
MEDAEELLAAVVAWARQDDRITALVQTGSRGRGDRIDRYSDLDLEIITPYWREFFADRSWLHRFGDVLLAVSFEDEDDADPDAPWPAPLLVVYAGGRKIDITIAGEERLTGMIEHGLEELYQRGFRVHLDRTGLTARLPVPTGKTPKPAPPDLAEFTAVTEEFFFEATQVPIYLNRGELWVAKFRDNTMKVCLLQMLEWYGSTARDHPRYTWYIGHHMDEWLPADLWRRVHETFGRFDADDARRALDASVDLFAEVAAEVAARLGFSWRGELVDGVQRLLAEYRTHP